MVCEDFVISIYERRHFGKYSTQKFKKDKINRNI